MKAAVGLLIFSLVIYSFLQGSTNGSERSTMTTNTQTAEKTFLALGDSYTIGESVSEDLRFPAQAVKTLNRSGTRFQTPTYVARTGWTTLDLINAIKSAGLSAKYDYVTLLIGVNDQYQQMDIAGYGPRFTRLLQTSIQYAGGRQDHVLVLSIPDYSITPFVPHEDKATVSAAIDAYNSINKEITTRNGCTYIDISGIYRDGANDRALIAGDNLHPTGQEYQKWASLVVQHILSQK